MAGPSVGSGDGEWKIAGTCIGDIVRMSQFYTFGKEKKNESERDRHRQNTTITKPITHSNMQI